MKIITSGPAKACVLALSVAVYLVMSVIDLDKDVINPDGINWHARTQAFTKALVTKHYGETFQAYHPGTTLMWLTGVVAGMSPDVSKESFLARDYFAKLSVVLFGTLVFAGILTTLRKLAGFKYAVVFGLLTSLEPFVVGMRRLYHLDYLMTVALFLAFLLLIYYNYKSTSWFLIPLAGLLFVLAVLTKSVAVLLLPVIPFMFILGNSNVLRKASGFLGFVVCVMVFMYALFPPIWKNPIKSLPKYVTKVGLGVSEIGFEGKKELGSSGKLGNVTLDDTLEDRDANFYLASLFMRLSPAGAVLLIVSTAVYIYVLVKNFILGLWRSVRTRNLPKSFTFSPAAWVCFWSLGFAVVAMLALTLSTKKSDRYEIILVPFLFTLVAYASSKVRCYIVVPVMLCYTILLVLELLPIHPYYLAYSNPYLGGLETRLRVLDGAPFGIGTYEAFNIVKRDLAQNNFFGYYTVAGSKSIKAISVGGRFSRVPSYVTDYVVVFAFDDKPTYSCINRYALITTVKIDGFDYWYVYKRLNQRHASNYE